MCYGNAYLFNFSVIHGLQFKDGLRKAMYPWSFTVNILIGYEYT